MVLFLVQAKNFSLLQSAQIASGAHPAFYSVGTEGYFPRVKWSRHDTDQSSIQEESSGTFTYPYACMACKETTLF